MTGPSSTACSCQRKLYEWNAFIWPREDLPLIRAQMRERWGPTKRDQWAMEFLKEQSGLRRYVLRELKRRGPLPSRELQHTSEQFPSEPSGGGRALS